MSERNIEQETVDELAALTAEIGQLVLAKAEHIPEAHEDPTVQTDPSLRWCPGCRLRRLKRRLSELAEVVDEDRVLAHEKESKRERLLTLLKARRDLEAPKRE